MHFLKLALILALVAWTVEADDDGDDDQCGDLTNDNNVTACSSDCFKSRFDSSPYVFLGEHVSGTGITVYCWLKIDPGLEDRETLFVRNDASSNCGVDGNEIEPPPRYKGPYIIFANHSNRIGRSGDVEYITLTAEPILTNTDDAWDLAKSYCGVSLARVISDSPRSNTPLNCCPPANIAGCRNNMLVSQIEGLSIPLENLTNVTTTTAPATTTQIGQCIEDCLFQVCDSHCLNARIDNATEVFWGENVPGNTDGNQNVTVYCWLKSSSDLLESQILITGHSEPTHLRCKDWAISDTGPMLFFAVRNNTGNTLFSIAKPVDTSSFYAWKQVTSLCSVEKVTTPTQPLATPPFTCSLSHSGPSDCNDDVAVNKIIYLSGLPCDASDDSLVTRFGAASGSPDEFLVTYADVVSQDDDDGFISLKNACTLNTLENPFNFSQISEKGPDTCFDLDFYQWRNQACILGVRQSAVATKPMVIESPDAWLAVSRLCALWRLDSTGNENCPKSVPNDVPSYGCFFDLSAIEIQRPSFSLNEKLKNCSTITPDSFAKRLDQSDVVAFGSLAEINYKQRKLSFKPECFLKGQIELSYNVVTLNIPPEADGCFSIDEWARRMNTSFILFFNKSKYLTMADIVIANRTQLSLFASVCDTLAVGGCPAKIDPRYGCYSDVNISSIVSTNEPELPPLRIRNQCCEGLTSNFTNMTWALVDQVVWGTVETIISLTKPEANGDRLVVVELIAHCYLNDREKSEKLGVVINTKLLTSTVHIGSDYIVAIRRISNSPWPMINFEAVTPFIPGTNENWLKFCSICNFEPTLSPYPTGSTDEDIEKCGGSAKLCSIQSSSLRQSGECLSLLDLRDRDIVCPVLSDDFATRLLQSGTGDAVAIWGEVISADYVKAIPQPGDFNATLQMAIPSKTPRDNWQTRQVLYKPLCQISGDDKPSMPSGVASFEHHFVDCFYEETFGFFQAESYVIFLAPKEPRTVAPAFTADAETIAAIAKSCAIKPPPYPILAPDATLLINNSCPLYAPSPENCDSSISISLVAKQDSPPDDIPSEITVSTWWVIFLITVGSLVCAVLSAFCIGFGIQRCRGLAARGENVSMVNMLSIKTTKDGHHQLMTSDEDYED